MITRMEKAVEEQELTNLRNSMAAIQTLVSDFSQFREENSQLNTLLEKLGMILTNNAPPLSSSSPAATSSNARVGADIDIDPFEVGNNASSGSDHKRKHIKTSVTADDDDEASSSNATKRLRGRGQDQNNTSPTTDTEDEQEVKLETSESEELPQMHPMFSIELVMLEILKYLPNKELINCRTVNSAFNTFATQVIRHRESIKVHFQYDWSKKEYISIRYNKPITPQDQCQCQDQDRGQSVNENANEFTLTSFTNFVKKRQNFPCTFFLFSLGTLSSKDLQEFLSIRGKEIKRLSIHLFIPPRIPAGSQNQIENQNQNFNQNEDQNQYNNPALNSNNGCSCDFPTIFLLRELLLNQAPNLKVLGLGGYPSQWKSSVDRLFPEPKGKEIYLPKLKSLSLAPGVPDKIFDDLLKAGINLQEVNSFLNPGPLLKANRFHLIKKLVWEVNLEDIEEYEKNPKIVSSQLEKIIMSPRRLSPDPHFLIWPKVSKAINNILEVSSSKLSLFSLAAPIGYLPNLKIPNLPLVKSMKLGMVQLPDFLHKTEYKQYFPRGFQFAHSFPNLQTVTFAFDSFSRHEVWEDYFEINYQPVLAVKTLIFAKTKYLPVTWMQNFALLFPNVEKLEINTNFFHFPYTARHGLWSFVKLKELSFIINLNGPPMRCKDMDSAFTGFSVETCKNLLGSSDMVDVSTVCNLRVHPSITGLKDLQVLSLTFMDEFSTIRHSYPPILSHVTGLFAFQMCPNLHVHLDYRIKNPENLTTLEKALSPIFPYVILRTEQN